MDNPICSKISTLISLYIDDKLSFEERHLVENHLADCPKCRDKYVRMKNEIKNLRKSYNNLLTEFERIENNNIFKIKEYEIFYSNISSYIDNELPYNEAVRFRKYLLKSKPAQKGLKEAYSLENTLKTAFSEYADNLKINYSKNIIEKLKEERKEPIDMIFKRMIITLGVLLAFTIAFFVYATASYNKHVSENTTIETQELVPDVNTYNQTEETEQTEALNSNEEQTQTSETLADVPMP